MPRGGPVTPLPNTSHPNRSDLTQAPKANKGQPYGTRSKQLDAQSVVPLPSSPTPQANTNDTTMVMAPGSIPGMADPTAYPEQPVTAGLPNSPGVGPEALTTSQATFAPEELSIARALYGKYRHQSLLDLVNFMESRL